ncbi:hypothetical protein [Thermincola potens]|uniref:CpXC domain-containing protein n=1 Tax=Thermincola potens (strain JR) TaxID=635013 RepID=D5XDK4_THEPJ|nr:hypothetical protein [Thermincola potens]ADG83750.1 conserved hypothetical protein [Thermincola potens JR]
MIIATETVIAMRCPSCGKLEFHKLSRFDFAGTNTVKVSCTCGAPKLIIGTKNRQQFWLQIPCVLCETNHLVYYRARQLWNEQVNFFYCSDTNVELGFFGPDEKVRAVAENYEHNLETLVDELGYDDYFFNPEVMFEVLNYLHDFAEEGYLYCECGSFQIEIDIFPDRIELQCKDCGAESVVYAETDDDLINIQNIKKIELVKNGFKSLNSIKNNNSNSGKTSGPKPKKRNKR